jgi:hypothetical protein
MFNCISSEETNNIHDFVERKLKIGKEFAEKMQEKHDRVSSSAQPQLSIYATNLSECHKRLSYHVNSLETLITRSKTTSITEADFTKLMSAVSMLSQVKLEIVVRNLELCRHNNLSTKEEMDALRAQEDVLRKERKDTAGIIRNWCIIQATDTESSQATVGILSTWKSILYNNGDTPFSKVENTGYGMALKFFKEIKTSLKTPSPHARDLNVIDQELKTLKALTLLSHMYRIMDVIAERNSQASTIQRDFDIIELENAFNICLKKYEVILNSNNGPGDKTVDPLVILKKHNISNNLAWGYIGAYFPSPSNLIRLKETCRATPNEKSDSNSKLSVLVKNLLIRLFKNEKDVEETLNQLLDKFKEFSEKNPAQALDLIPRILASCNILATKKEFNLAIVKKLIDIVKLVGTRFVALEKMAEEENPEISDYLALAEISRLITIVNQAACKPWMKGQDEKSIPDPCLHLMQNVRLLNVYEASKDSVQWIETASKVAQICLTQVREEYFLQLMSDRLAKSIIDFAATDQNLENPRLNILENIKSYFEAIYRSKTKLDLLVCTLPVLFPVAAFVLWMFFPAAAVTIPFLTKFSVMSYVWKFAEKLVTKGKYNWLGPFTSLADQLSPTRKNIVDEKKAEKKRVLRDRALMMSKHRFRQQGLDRLVDEWVNELKSYGTLHHVEKVKYDILSNDKICTIVDSIDQEMRSALKVAEEAKQLSFIDYLTFFTKELNVDVLRNKINAKLKDEQNLNDLQKQNLINDTVNFVIHNATENHFKLKMKSAMDAQYSALFMFSNSDAYFDSMDVRNRLSDKVLNAAKVGEEAIVHMLNDQLKLEIEKDNRDNAKKGIVMSEISSLFLKSDVLPFLQAIRSKMALQPQVHAQSAAAAPSA